ncbi:MAG: FKBP-type peptidyl-prolyl cis-trans isomerase [Dehalococcoidia bacterium]
MVRRICITLGLAALVASAGAFAACGDDNKDGPSGEGTTTVSDVDITDVVVGDGAEATAGSTVTVHYTLFLEDGTKVQSSKDSGQPFTSPLSELIPGWQEGIPGMKVGGTRRLVIPPELAYGAAGSPPDIPGNATLTFEIELLGVE